MPLAEYNRLLDLAARAPAPRPRRRSPRSSPAPTCKVTVDRDTARGVFNLTGQVLQPA